MELHFWSLLYILDVVFLSVFVFKAMQASFVIELGQEGSKEPPIS